MRLPSHITASALVALCVAGDVFAQAEDRSSSRPGSSLAATPGSHSGSALAASPQQAPSPAGPSVGSTSTGNTIIYRPPRRGSPGGRVGGSSRGADVAATTLTALVPNHTGLTIASQPVLYWYLSQPSTHPIEITVVPEAGTSPLFESRLNPPIAAGVHEFRLADLGVQLSPNSVYHWYVAMVRNADRRSQDLITGGVLERVTSPEGLAAALAIAPLADHPRLYADAGLWYDALDALSHLIKTAPTDLTWRAQRAALLDQAMLTEAAMYDREAMPQPANP